MLSGRARLTQINKEYNSIREKLSKLTDKLIAEGHGAVRHSELGKLDSPTAKAYLELSSKADKLIVEGGRIWGPGYTAGRSSYAKDALQPIPIDDLRPI